MGEGQVLHNPESGIDNAIIQCYTVEYLYDVYTANPISFCGLMKICKHKNDLS